MNPAYEELGDLSTFFAGNAALPLLLLSTTLKACMHTRAAPSISKRRRGTKRSHTHTPCTCTSQGGSSTPVTAVVFHDERGTRNAPKNVLFCSSCSLSSWLNLISVTGTGPFCSLGRHRRSARKPLPCCRGARFLFQKPPSLASCGPMVQ